MAAEGLIDFEELRAKLAALEETRETARRELATLEAHREQLAELERDRDAVMERYAEMMPEAIDTLTPAERHHVYKLLKLKVKLHADGTPEVNGTLGDYQEVCKTDTLS